MLRSLYRCRIPTTAQGSSAEILRKIHTCNCSYRWYDRRQLILPDVYVSTVPIAPGRTNKRISDRVVGFNTEDKEINEGEVRFDLIFYAQLPERCEQNELHRLLSAIYSNQMKSPGILNILEQEYSIPITEDLGEEINDMCNLGEGIEERAEQRGLEQGLEQGLRMLCELIIEGDLTMERAVSKAVALGITGEAELRSRAAELGINLPA